MILSFQDVDTEKIFKGERSLRIDHSIQNIARRKLRMLDAAKILEDLRIPPGNRLEKLQGSLENLYSIRINDQWRIIFNWKEGAENVRITDYHK